MEALQVDDAYARRDHVAVVLAAIVLFCICWSLGAEPARADCAPPSSLPPICLSGTVTAPGYGSALVAAAGTAGSDWLRQGDTLLDWKIALIGSGYVVLTRRGQSVRLDIAGGVTDHPPALAIADHPAAPPAAGPPQVKQGPMLRQHSWERRGEREPPQ
jgi:hypothetical protein